MSKYEYRGCNVTTLSIRAKKVSYYLLWLPVFGIVLLGAIGAVLGYWIGELSMVCSGLHDEFKEDITRCENAHYLNKEAQKNSILEGVEDDE